MLTKLKKLLAFQILVLTLLSTTCPSRSLPLLQDKNFDNYKKKDEERRKFTRAQTMTVKAVLWLYNKILMDIYSVEL